MDLDEKCLTCNYPRGAHRTDKIGWIHYGERIEFWQQDICPWLHNLVQPSWDLYLFRGSTNGKWNGPL